MRNKRKGILMASAILGSAAIVSTGFAAWVITIDGSATADGTIEVDTVTDESITLTVLDQVTVGGQPVKQDANVMFGASEKAAGVTGTWLEPTATEDLDAEFYIKVVGANYLDSTPLTLTLAEKDGAELYKDAADAGYVAALPTQAAGKITATSFTCEENTGGNVAVYKVSISFNWGGYFEGVNPTNFYNKYTPETKRSATSATVSANATDLLSDVKAVLMDNASAYRKLADAKFTLTVASNRKPKVNP